MRFVYNILVVAIFGFLVWYFNHWWIVLFALLFVIYDTSEDKENKHKENDNELR